jgi:hypothetical protein
MVEFGGMAWRLDTRCILLDYGAPWNIGFLGVHSGRSRHLSNTWKMARILNFLVTDRSTFHLNNGIERQVQDRNASACLIQQL